MNHCGVLRKINGAFDPPRVRVTVANAASRQQRIGSVQSVGDIAVDLKDVLAGKQRHLLVVATVVIDRTRNFDAVARTELEVVGTVTRSNMDEPGALFHVDKLRRQHDHVEVVALTAERMRAAHAIKRRTLERGHNFVRGDRGLGAHRLDQWHGR